MKIYKCRRKKKSASVTNNGDLPEAIIEETLSRLPVKSLLRFKCVSKHWNSTILDPHFISLHHENSSTIIYNKSEDNEFFVIDECKGLFLEKSRVESSSDNNGNSRRYLIRNPEIGQIIQIPNPQKSPSLRMYLAFLPSKNLFKVLSIYFDKNRDNLGCQILSLGNEINISTSSWRFLELPTLQNAENLITNFHLLVQYEVTYCIWEVSNISQNRIGIEIDILDMENEIFIGTTITLPEDNNFASKLTFDDYFQWNGKVSFGKFVKDELHVLVLDDYKTNKWIEEKQSIKMKNLKEEDEQIKIICVCDFALYFVVTEKKKLCRYSFSSEKLEIVFSDYDESTPLVVTHSSLFTLNGMH